MLDPKTSIETPIDPNDIKVLTIINQSQFLMGAGYGILTGSALGMIIGLASGNDEPGFMSWTAGQKAAAAGTAFGVIGGMLGGIAGLAAAADETINIKEKETPGERAKLLGKLRALARFPDEQ